MPPTPVADGDRVTSGLLRRSVLACAVAGLLLAAPEAATAQEDPASRTGLTVYNDDRALVEEHHTLLLEEGSQTTRIRDVPARLDPTSVTLRFPRDPAGTRVLEHDFGYDLAGPDRLLARYVGQEIEVTIVDGSTHRGTLLSADDGVVLDVGEGVRLWPADRVEGFRFPELPEGLRTRPALEWTVEADRPGSHRAVLNYLTGGVSWRADYVLDLPPSGERMDLRGRMSLDNESGRAYVDANLRMVAGEIGRAPETRRQGGIRFETAQVEDQVQARELSEYHLYEIDRPVTVEDRQTKQIEFLASDGVPVDRTYVYEGTSPGWIGEPRLDRDAGVERTPTGVDVHLSFETGEEAGLGRRLPAGTVRMYQEDADGTRLLIGEDRIGHTPENESVRLTVGRAFDLVGERTRVDYRRIGEQSLEETVRIELRNRKAQQAVTIRVREALYRAANWEIHEERVDGEPVEHRELDSQRVEWRVDVPAGGTRTLTYRVQYNW